MMAVWKILILLAIANIILIPIEWYRYTHKFRNWRFSKFLDDHLLSPSYIVSFIDMLVIVVAIFTMLVNWLISPEWI